MRKDLFADAAYLGRYAGQRWDDVVRMPRSVRRGLIEATSRIVGEEKGD